MDCGSDYPDACSDKKFIELLTPVFSLPIIQEKDGGNW